MFKLDGTIQSQDSKNSTNVVWNAWLRTVSECIYAEYIQNCIRLSINQYLAIILEERKHDVFNEFSIKACTELCFVLFSVKQKKRNSQMAASK